MVKKVFTGLVLGGAAILIVTYANYVLLGAVAVMGALGLWEYFQMLKKKQMHPMPILGIIAGECFIVMAFLCMRGGDMDRASDGYGMVVTAFVFVILIIQFIQIVNHRHRFSILDLAITVFASIYVCGFGSMIFLIHGFGLQHFPHDVLLNRLVLFFPFWAAYSSDVGAYFAGSFLGKTRLFPDLSPKKTLEGCIGGVVFSSVGTVVLSYFIGIPLIHALILGPVASIAGQIGDLSESALKREIGVKDSGKIFGSHGGVLDRIDSFLFATPVIYYYFIWFCPWA